MYKLIISSSFSAAHFLRGYKGVCCNMHGHNWEVKVCFSTEELNELGMGEDFKNLKSALSQILTRFDHKILNEIEPFIEINPTSENLSEYIFNELSNKVKEIKVMWVEVAENKDCIARFEK